MANYSFDVARTNIGTQSPYDTLYQSLRKFINDYYYDRKNAIIKYWDYWRGDQSKYMQKYRGESDTEFANRQKMAAVENHCKTTCNINVAYMYGLSDKIGRRAENEQLNEILNEDVYYYNEMATLMMDTRLMASVTGMAVMETAIYNKATKKPFFGGEAITKDNFYVHYRLSDSQITIPLPRLDDRRELGAIIKYYQLDDVDQYEFFGIEYKAADEVWVLEYVNDYVWLRWWHYKNDANNATIVPVFNQEAVKNINIYGDVRVPFVLFKNIGDPMTLEGESDLEDAIPLQDNLNARMTDDAIVIAYHSLPLLKALRGAKIPDNFVRKPNSILEIDGDGDVEYATWEDKLEASHRYKSDIRSSIAEATQVSQLSRGNMGGVGQLKTGIGVKSLYVPDIIGVRMRRPYMVKGEKDLIFATAKLYEKYGNYDFDENYRCEIFMPEDFIGIDEYMETQIKNLRIQSGLPMEEELEEENPDATESEIKKMESELKQKNQPKPSPLSEQKQLEKG